MSGEQSGKESNSSCNSSASSNTSGEPTAVATVRPFAVKDERVRKPITIHEAACNGDIEAIKEFLDQGVDAEFRDSRSNTALHYAVENNREEVLKFLLDKGARISVRGHSRDTLLHTASYFGRDNVLKYLIESGASVKVVNSDEQTPLLYACMKGHLVCVKMLLDTGADLSKADSCGLTPLMYAAQLGGMNQSSSEGEPSFDTALEKKYLQIAEKLIEKGANVNSLDLKKRSPLHFAAAKGSVKMIRILLKAGADHLLPDDMNIMPFDLAGLNGHEQAVYELLEFLPDGTVPLSSMELAADKGDVNFMKMLVKAFSPKAFHSCNALLRAILSGHLECVQFLIHIGFDVNKYGMINNRSIYPLGCAAKEGKLDCLRELLKAGADVDARYDETWYTALHLAAKFGHKQCIEELLRAGAKHLRTDYKYPWQLATNTDIQQLLQEHQKQQQ